MRQQVNRRVAPPGRLAVLGVALALSVALASGATWSLDAQSITASPYRPQYQWGELPAGRTWGSTSAVEIAADGNIWVAERCGANTCVGSTVDPIQLFDQKGNFLAIWTQFGRPSGIYIDRNDVIYVADSESSPTADKFMGMRNAGFEKGIRIGDARTGWVRHFLPDDRDVMGYSGPEGVAVDAQGNVYGAEVTQRRVVKWMPFRR